MDFGLDFKQIIINANHFGAGYVLPHQVVSWGYSRLSTMVVMVVVVVVIVKMGSH